MNPLPCGLYKYISVWLSQTQHGITPLAMASQNGHFGIATLLIEHHADVNKYDEKVSNAMTLLLSEHYTAGLCYA